jgi:hypothetical protein
MPLSKWQRLLFSNNRLMHAVARTVVAWSAWIDQHRRITWIDCDHMRISRCGLWFGRWKMGNQYKDFYSWPNKRGVIRWFLQAAERGTDLPLFPDTAFLKTVMAAIEKGGISIPKRKKEAVAAALLKLRLDMAEKG